MTYIPKNVEAFIQNRQRDLFNRPQQPTPNISPWLQQDVQPTLPVLQQPSEQQLAQLLPTQTPVSTSAGVAPIAQDVAPWAPNHFGGHGINYIQPTNTANQPPQTQTTQAYTPPVAPLPQQPVAPAAQASEVNEQQVLQQAIPQKPFMAGPRKVLPAPEKFVKNALTSSLVVYNLKYNKAASIYLNRGHNSRARQEQSRILMQCGNELTDLVVACEKSPNNKSKIFELDNKHQALRVKWLSYYDAGFLGEYRQGTRYDPHKGLKAFAEINEHLDNMGRIIGAMKKRASSKG